MDVEFDDEGVVVSLPDDEEGDDQAASQIPEGGERKDDDAD